MPGAGFMPKLVAGLLMLFGAMLIIRAWSSPNFSELDWGDLGHAAFVIATAALAVMVYTRLGFVLTMSGMLFAFLTAVERKRAVRAALFSIVSTLLTYGLFTTFLRVPLPSGPFRF